MYLKLLIWKKKENCRGIFNTGEGKARLSMRMVRSRALHLKNHSQLPMVRLLISPQKIKPNYHKNFKKYLCAVMSSSFFPHWAAQIYFWNGNIGGPKIIRKLEGLVSNSSTRQISSQLHNYTSTGTLQLLDATFLP